MNTHYMIRRIAGAFVLISLAMGYWVSPGFYLFTAFVGANLLQSSFTRWCLMDTILNAMGVSDKEVARSAPTGTRSHTEHRTSR